MELVLGARELTTSSGFSRMGLGTHACAWVLDRHAVRGEEKHVRTQAGRLAWCAGGSCLEMSACSGTPGRDSGMVLWTWMGGGIWSQASMHVRGPGWKIHACWVLGW